MYSLLLCCLVLGGSAAGQRRFPDDFMFGTATAAYQIEGAWNVDDKSESMWDYMVHKDPGVISDRSNGDIATNSYELYKRDVEMLRELGCDTYRFSLSWPRILPNGYSNVVSKSGIQFYNNFINELLKYNITPVATMYHWDLPQKLQELGGFSSPMLADWFEDYARVVFDAFGDRVKNWITFNEPYQICYQGYGFTSKAPALNMTDVGTYICAKNLVVAHARAYHLYVDEFKEVQQGVVGITTEVKWISPLTDDEDDVLAAEIKRQGDWILYTEPIFSKEGGFPKEFAEVVARKSAEQGYTKSRLPEFTEEEKAFVRGTADFFGINHYTGNLASGKDYKLVHPVPSYLDDIDVGVYVPPEWEAAQSVWLKNQQNRMSKAALIGDVINEAFNNKTSLATQLSTALVETHPKFSPKSLYNALTQVAERYNNPIIYITENGWSTAPEAGLNDDDRIRYYRAAWEDVLDALDDGVNVRGYMAWSLMDNFEWMSGYSERFGLYEVDFSSPDRTRTPKKSAFVYKELIRSRVVDHHYSPNTLTMWIDEGH